MKKFLISLAILTCAGFAVAHARASLSVRGTVIMTAAPADAMSEGEVRKVDKSGGKITIKHGPLRNLDMPAMTMVFKVTDKGLLDKLKPGDKIRFVAEDVSGALTVTTVQLMR
jgi:Cu(I)/Ag(I) efflux system protein CusF